MGWEFDGFEICWILTPAKINGKSLSLLQLQMMLAMAAQYINISVNKTQIKNFSKKIDSNLFPFPNNCTIYIFRILSKCSASALAISDCFDGTTSGLMNSIAMW